MVILNAIFNAGLRLNESRQKPLSIDAVYHFGDENREHVEFLRQTILDSQFRDLLGKSVALHHKQFIDLLPLVIADIKRRQRQGRAIFVLDQFGYADVPMSSIRTIFDNLPKAEVILTFSIDALLNYLQGEGDPAPVVSQFGVNEPFLRLWQEWKLSGHTGRAMAQRALMAQMHRYSGARFFTPFMMFSSTDNRHMLIAHLSQSQAARDKMLSVHWALKNTFKHIGRGSLFELGFDGRLTTETSLFEFSDADRGNMRRELEDELPKQIFELSGGGPLALGDLLVLMGNKTAATNKDIIHSLQRLSEAREIEVLRPQGGFTRPGAVIRPDHQLRVSRQLKLFGPQ
jgi:three-Cys-motif partner protein